MECRRITPSDGHIVADGAQRIRATEEYERRVRRIRAEVVDRYRVELASAGYFRRAIIHLRIQHAIRRELQKITPEEGLYFNT